MSNIIKVDFAQQNTQLELRLRDHKERSDWYLSLLSWVDFEDVLNLKRSAFIVLMDMIANRPTEFSVFASFYLSAYKRQGWRVELTAKEQEAETLALEAVGLGLNPAKYIAQRTGMSIWGAYKRLERAAKVSKNAEKSHTSIREYMRMPSEVAIKRKMAQHRHRCPGYGAHEDCEEWTRGDRDLCHPCAKHYGFAGERPDWLEFLIRDNRKLARQQAYDDLIGLVPYQEQDYDDLDMAA